MKKMIGLILLTVLLGCYDAPKKQEARLQAVPPSGGAASSKDMLPKLRGMAEYTKKALPPRLGLTSNMCVGMRDGVVQDLPCSTSSVKRATVVTPQQGNLIVTWPDGAGGTYGVNVPASQWTHTPAPPPPPPPTPTGVPIPSNATTSGALEGAANWKWNHDAGTPGNTTNGATVYPAPAGSPAVAVAGTTARAYSFNYTGKAGEIYHLSFASNTTATHFVYDTYVWFPDVSQLQNVEMDMNQVVANGKTVIFGTQCASGSGTWEYTTMVNGGSHWSKSNIPCNPQKWTAKAWHHIQIATERNADGSTATYDAVCVDGACSNFIGATGPNGLALGWASVLLLNFQLDGTLATGAISAYTDKLQIYYW